MNGGNRLELQWQLLRSFFRSRAAFLTLFERYESRVLDFAGKFKTDRSRLRLGADELLTLLDFKSLEDLRDREILTLKETAHLLFRGPDATDRIDHYVSNIYHELSILKEEHYTLKEDFVRSDKREYDRLFREVSEFYPKRLRHVRNLYRKALRRIELLLPELMGHRIVMRSIYLFGDELLGGNYRHGLKGLYRKIYPDLGEARGFYEVGASFLASGFEDEARDAFERAGRALKVRRRRRDEAKARDLLEEVEGHLDSLGPNHSGSSQSVAGADEGKRSP